MKKWVLSTVVIWLMSFVYGVAQTQQSVMPRDKQNVMNLKRMDTATKKEYPKFINLGKDFILKSIQKNITNIPDDQAEVFAFTVFNLNYRTRGVVNFVTNDISSMRMLKDYGGSDGDYAMCAGTMVGDEYWGYLYRIYGGGSMYVSVGLGKLDLETGLFELMFNYNELGFETLLADMTYDPYTDKIYAIGRVSDEDLSSSIIYEIDIKEDGTGFPEYKGLVDKYLFTLSADNGYLYGIANQDNSDPENTTACLYKMDISKIDAGTEEIEYEKIGSGFGKAISYSQTMEFDHTTHKLWWAGEGFYSGEWFGEVDINTGRLINEQSIPGQAQLVAMAIPYQKVADNAPSFVRNLKVISGEKGIQTANLTWSNPTKNYQLQPLSELQGVKIYRDGELKATLTNGETSWEEKNIPSGIHTYRVQTYNQAGDGLYKERTLFIGRDIPGRVEDLSLTAEGCKGTLTWKAPTVGKNGGWFDAATITYTIVRMPDNKTMKTGLKETTFEDTVDKLEGYYYIVTASNPEGDGEQAVSNIVSYGPALDVPFVSSLSTVEDFNRWQNVDANHDGNKWTYSSQTALYEYNGNAANDYLATPPLNMKKNTEYRIDYEYQTGGDKNCFERFEVVWGKSATPESMTNQASLYENLFNPMWKQGRSVIAIPNDDSYVVAFHCISDPNQWMLQIRDISIREYSSTDLSVIAFTGNELVNQNKPFVYRMKVVNEGKAKQENFKLQLIDSDTNGVLAEAQGTAIEPGDTIQMEVTWTPLEKGTFNVQGVIDLNGDTFPLDNISSQKIAVTVQDENADMWTSIGKKGEQGFASPFYVFYKYSQTQTIYYKDELNIKDKSKLVGIGYSYVGSSDCENMVDIPVQIYIQNTDADALEDGFLPDAGFTLVYEGTIDVNGEENEQFDIDCMFDQAFEYTGKNICVKAVRPLQPLAEGNPYWEIFEDPDHPLRARSYRRDQAYEEGVTDPGKVGVCDVIPYTRLAYRDGETGIQHQTSFKLHAIQQGDKVSLSNLCDEVKLLDVAGVEYYHGNNVTEIPVSGLQNGIYLISARYGDTHAVIKLVIK